MFQKEFDNTYYYNNEGDLTHQMYCKKIHKSTLIIMITESL